MTFQLHIEDGRGLGSAKFADPLPSIEDAQAKAEEHFGGPLWWETPVKGRHPNPSQFAGYYLIEEIEDDMTETEQQADLSTLIQKQIQDALGQMAQQPAQSFEEALAKVDPADSEAALAMLDFLLKTGRLGRVGTLDGGQGYLFMYQEPKGATKQGYVPGGTKGDQIVDQALEAQRAAGVKPVKQGMCPGCFSVVADMGDGVIVNAETHDPACAGGGAHQMA